MEPKPICSMCHLPHDGTPGWHPCIEAQAKAMVALLNNVADVGHCKGCGASIKWVRHRNGKRTPYDISGLNHFVSCPDAKEFKKP